MERRLMKNIKYGVNRGKAILNVFGDKSGSLPFGISIYNK
jgi:hypothetical protein